MSTGFSKLNHVVAGLCLLSLAAVVALARVFNLSRSWNGVFVLGLVTLGFVMILVWRRVGLPSGVFITLSILGLAATALSGYYGVPSSAQTPCSQGMISHGFPVAYLDLSGGMNGRCPWAYAAPAASPSMPEYSLSVAPRFNLLFFLGDVLFYAGLGLAMLEMHIGLSLRHDNGKPVSKVAG